MEGKEGWLHVPECSNVDQVCGNNFFFFSIGVDVRSNVSLMIPLRSSKLEVRDDLSCAVSQGGGDSAWVA